MFAEEQPALAPLPARAVSLLPLRRPHGASRWLRRSRRRLLQRAARLDRPARRRAVERPPRPPARSEHGPAAARACAGAAGLAPDRRRRSPRDARRRRRWRCSARAMRAGAAHRRLCDAHSPHDGAGGVRRILGVLALAKKHGPAAVEDAARPRSTSACRPITSCGATSNGVRRRR